MSEIKKTCNNCKHCNCPPSNDPCKTCLTRGFIEHKFDTMWESKEDEKDDNLVKVAKLIHENGIYGSGSGFVVLPMYADMMFKTESDRKVDHIDKRVEDIQHNILVYGNDIVSKIIAIQDKIGMTPDAEIYLKDIRQDLCDLDTKLDGLESMLKDIQKTLNEQPVVGDIHRVESKLDGLDIKQFTVDEGPARPEPKFKDGDLVKISGYGDDVWIIRNYHYDQTVNRYYYDLKSYFGNDNVIYCEELITPVPESKVETIEQKPKFKVGDAVKYKTGHVSYVVSNVKKLNTGYCYDLYRQFYDKPHNRDYKITGILESRLEEVK